MKKIEVFGTGCPKCKKTTEIIKQKVKELGLEAEISKVEDLNEIAARGVMMTPAVAVDGDIKVAGKVPSVGEVKSWFE